MAKKTEKKQEMVAIDPRIAAAVAADAATHREETPNLIPIITGFGKASVGDMEVGYDQNEARVDFYSGDKKIGTCTKLELYQFVFGICDESMREQLMPVRQSQVLTFERVHNVMLKKDMRKGQIMKVRCHMDVPVSIQESLRGLLRKDMDIPQHIIPKS